MRALILSVVAIALAALPSAAQSPQHTPAKSTSSRAAKATASPGAPVNLNTATEAQLQTLPGIGAKAAQRILEFRQKNGGFKKIEDLMNVKGIGEKNFLKLKPLITVSGQKADSTTLPRQ